MIAERGYTCVNGAGRYGVMGGVNNGCSSKGGRIIGVIHSIFCVDTSEHPFIKDIVVVGGIDLYQRKLELFNNSDCVLVLPGGVGTFDELWDGISSRSLGMKDMVTKPICIVNIDGYYDGSIAQMHRAKKDGILYEEVDEYFHVEDNVQDALNWCELAVHNSRKAGMDTHHRKVERMITRSNNLPDVPLDKPTHMIRHTDTSSTSGKEVSTKEKEEKEKAPARAASAVSPALLPVGALLMFGLALSRWSHRS
jgi:uncharacterized protein (TIGR00730 family)